jgi:hypothetical protein
MSEIKNYSSPFATKLNYVLDLSHVAPLQYGRTKAIENITSDKLSTVNHWLFDGKLPRESKRLAIADALGVSHNYLFNDKIKTKDLAKPEIYRDEQYYQVPYIDENNIFELKDKKIFPIKTRLLIMLPGLNYLVEKYGTNIYATTLKSAIFEPYVGTGSNILYSENIILENFNLVIYQNPKNNEIIIKRVIEEMSRFYLEWMNNKKLIKESLNKSHKLLSIVLTYSKSLLSG